jgi:hypothetical protein
MTRFKWAFGTLVLVQAAHSVEECAGRLWESFPPAHFLAGLISDDRAWNFAAMNAALVGFGVWCFLWPVRCGWASGWYLGWVWVMLEAINGIVHSIWALREGGYTPGVATAPALLALAIYLASQLRNVPHPPPRQRHDPN